MVKKGSFKANESQDLPEVKVIAEEIDMEFGETISPELKNNSKSGLVPKLDLSSSQR